MIPLQLTQKDRIIEERKNSKITAQTRIPFRESNFLDRKKGTPYKKGLTGEGCPGFDPLDLKKL
jgi:hypothetical protein